ncbi:hypothetical protein [Granulosicoccus antarcticus]|uniref:hypothetical protein n=1 Tax=Granulosicoccus antarcticus TaxID=437505 RepID=UPI00197B0503|nr:hypothetical protein [Granulosicoccus antarcticus]
MHLILIQQASATRLGIEQPWVQMFIPMLFGLMLFSIVQVYGRRKSDDFRGLAISRTEIERKNAGVVPAIIIGTVLFILSFTKAFRQLDTIFDIPTAVLGLFQSLASCLCSSPMF